MNDQLFVIAIGGTGMRCLESFVHLCAIGMFDNQEINVLTLDTDQTNGNKERVELLINYYNRIKSDKVQDIDGGTPNTNTFFSAKINLFKFWTDYSTTARQNYVALSRLGEGSEEAVRQNSDLSNLFLDKTTVQQFNLAHGYRAQTHLGSHLMYHGIIESARRKIAGGVSVKPEDKDLDSFLELLSQASAQARVFVFGSVFGGTGASSIPIIPVAMRDAVSIRSNGKSSLALDKVKFGSTLLTEYFSFPNPDARQMAKDKVIANSDFFALNSQAALHFYQADPTVKLCYRRLYHIGWPLTSKPIADEKEGDTITGGREQKNNCHVVELMCACAAYDFFTIESFPENKTNANYVYRSVEKNQNVFDFNGGDFVGEHGDQFVNKLGAFLSLSHIVLGLNGASSGGKGTKAFLDRLKDNNRANYNIDDIQLEEIDKYLQMFAYSVENGKLQRGWLYQIYNTVKPGKFIFRPTAFEEKTDSLSKIEPGTLFDDDKHNWDAKGGFMHSTSTAQYNQLIKILTEDSASMPSKEQNANTTKEKFLAHVYNAITIAQKFNIKN